jgi:hypothetical protein
LELTVKVTDISPSGATPAMHPASAGPIRICDRCHNVSEIVVAVMEILALEQTWALCGPCKQELPKGFHLV